ncbi:MAG: hypothetical protein HUU54_02050 [Ignavibacteriaceae bacterium]|nr:hypothetical protein [Ignavibacteriaceae bacterium]
MRVLILIFFLAGWTNPQSNVDALKAEAQRQMSIGRYGEAIDLLNKYIASRPSKADGLHLRGLCYEKRGQYEYSVFDLRNARKLEPKNSEINKDLGRVTSTWHQLLRKKISGHKREIAINPAIPLNYLEIGKSHKHLGEWEDAEWWYDEYIKREDPSSDEVIRYTEILAHNNHIEKGERILKKYVEKFPKDHRLWSRYGYFTMWLGKKKIAIDAFTTALSFRPFFREAQEGLEQAENRPYIYTVVDTVVDLKKLQEQQTEKEYYIDRLYREIRQTPGDIEKRYALIDALIGVNRFEEAYQQLQILSVEHSGTEKFDTLWEFVTSKKDSLARFNIDKYKALYDADKNNKANVMRLAELYAATMDFDSAIEILTLFISTNKMEGNNDVRFMLAKYTAFNQQFEPSIEQLNILLKSEPENYEYKLLRALVAVWTTTDLDLAKSLLEEYLVKFPESVEAIVAYANLMVKERKFTEAKSLIEKARGINPNAREIESVQNYYDAILELEEDRKVFKILEEARELAVAQNCPDAVVKYDEYFSKLKSPSRFEWIEYADVNSCARNFNKSIEVYDRLLEQEYDIDIAILRSKNYLWSGDSIKALNEFTRLVAEDSTSFDAKFYLAETYEVLKDFSAARGIYNQLLTETVDSNKIRIINLRLGWLPKGGGDIFSLDIPTFVRIAPVYNFYSDNQNLKYNNTGGQIEFGLLSFLSAGVSFNRTTIETPGLIRFYTSMKWNLLANFDNKLYLNAGYGNLNYRNVRIRKVSDFGIRYFFDKHNNLSYTFENTDAAIVLYSARLGFQNINANFHRFFWNFRTKNMLYITGFYNFLQLNDGNSGKDMQLRIGRKFDYDILGGYEYLSTDYARYSAYYYSPQDFSAHSIWAEWEQKYDSTLTYTLGAKAGYIPASDFFIREVSAAAIYQPFKVLFISARISYGGTYRYDGSYEFLSAYVLAYWNVF